MYSKTKYFKEVIKMTTNTHISFYKEKYAVNKEGELVQKPYIDCFIPNYYHYLGGLGVTFIDMQTYFQKWATRTNIPFWNTKITDEVQLIYLFQQNFHGKNHMHENFVAMPNISIGFSDWVQNLNKRFLDYQTDYVIYTVICFGGFFYCLDIDFIENNKTLIQFSPIIEKEWYKFSIQGRFQGQTFELNKNYIESPFPVSEINKDNIKAYIIGYRENSEYSYTNLIY